MATYKVLQDIEAEDKLIGPLTLRQFIFALIAAFFGYLNFVVVSKGAAWLLGAFLPPMLIAGFFAYPWGRDQPTEVWALAKIRFLLKPKRRIWDQTGVKELVSVTAPKRIDRRLTNGLSDEEVEGRLKALSATIDTRGWIVKNVNYNLAAHPGNIASDLTMDSDRLLDIELLPEPPAPVQISEQTDDVLDEDTGVVAQKLDSLLQASSQMHRQALIDRMHSADAESTTATSAAPPKVTVVTNAEPAASAVSVAPKRATPDPFDNRWFAQLPRPQSSAPQGNVTFNTQVVAPGASLEDLPSSSASPTPDEESLIKQLDSRADQTDVQKHMHVLRPGSAPNPTQNAPTTEPARQEPTPQPTPAPAAQNQPQLAAKPINTTVTQPVDTGILELARNDDLNVATIQREANKRKQAADDEVVISLH